MGRRGVGSGVFPPFLVVLKIGKLHFPPFLAIGLFTISLNYKIDQCSPIRAITSENKQIPPIVFFLGGWGGSVTDENVTVLGSFEKSIHG